ncbi:MAG TPA: hypothetical protein VHE35_17225 [Kofleriaceae bacterium]|nr:hypothetical protein [Kofleriaceae bacterium]
MKTIASILFASLAALGAAACGDDGASTIDAPVIHEVDAGIDAPPADDCFHGTPTTNNELINACPGPGVTRIIKHPDLPLLNPDGTVPPLP